LEGILTYYKNQRSTIYTQEIHCIFALMKCTIGRIIRIRQIRFKNRCVSCI